MLRLASAARCRRGVGDTPAPRSSPTDVCPLPSPQAAFPVGNTSIKSAATTGEPGVENAWNASTDNGRSPAPLLDTDLPLTMSDTCTNEGVADTLSQGRAWSWRTPVNACSERRAVSFIFNDTTPT